MARANLRVFRHRRGKLALGVRTRLMGIVNLTSDSFSDGGNFLDTNKAVDHAIRLIDECADIIDLGAESTRPGSLPVSDDLQLERLLPVLSVLRPLTDAVISIDTRTSKVAEACFQEGADVINDVSGLSQDPLIADVCAIFGGGIVLMHMRGTPATMQNNTAYENVARDVHRELETAVAMALRVSLSVEQILVDPGLGFGKTFEQNYGLLAELRNLRGLAAGVLVGPSRKAFTGEFSGKPASARQFSTAAAVSISVLHGADVVRVHDVAQMREVADICDRFLNVTHEQS